MKGLTFDSFIAHETNQAAYDLCTKVAALDATLPRPIVLLGEQGAGKSHLLWSIVNHFRINDMKVGVALISAKDFPNKVKRLADAPENLSAGRPVFLLVDDLHLFDKDMEALERVLFAIHEHGHTAVLATSIHPNVLPSLSGKLKALMNNGAIIGIKALPKTEGAAIPEAALNQIARLKARVAELETAREALPVAGAPSVQEDGQAIVEQLDQLKHERDAARTALDNSETELLELRDNILRATELRDSALSETQALKNSMAVVMERLEKQRAAYASRIAAIEAQSDQLLAMARELGATPTAREGAESAEGEELAASEFNLAKAHQQLAIQTAEIDELRATSAKLAEALQRQETEVRRVIEGVRETLSALEAPSVDEEPETPPEARQALKTIVEQLDALECELPAPGESGADELFGGEGAIQTLDDIVSREDSPFLDDDAALEEGNEDKGGIEAGEDNNRAGENH